MAFTQGIVCSVDAATHTACVSIEGAGGVLEDVPVLLSLPASDLAPGDRVLVALGVDLGAVVLGAF